MPAQVFGYRLYHPFHEEEGRDAGWVEALAMPGVRLAERCWVYIGGGEDYEEEAIVVWAGGVYVVGTVLDDWFVVPPDAVKRFLAKLLKVKEEDVSLKC